MMNNSLLLIFGSRTNPYGFSPVLNAATCCMRSSRSTKSLVVMNSGLQKFKKERLCQSQETWGQKCPYLIACLCHVSHRIPIELNNAPRSVGDTDIRPPLSDLVRPRGSKKYRTQKNFLPENFLPETNYRCTGAPSQMLQLHDGKVQVELQLTVH